MSKDESLSVADICRSLGIGKDTYYRYLDCEAVGNGGDINIKTGSLSLTNGAQVAAGTRGKGDAGNVTIEASNTISFDGVGSNGLSSAALSSVKPEAVGNGGNINIKTGSLSVTNGVQVVAAISGHGDAGNVTIAARDTISFDGESDALSTVEAKAVGNGGDINKLLHI